MGETSKEPTQHQLHKTLGIRDLVLFNIVCIVGLSTLAQVAQIGFSSIPLYIICIFTFLIPSGLMVSELNARMPQEGGFYLWVRKAFGNFHGYVAAWSYWVCNIVWLATVVMLVTIPALYLFGDTYLHFADNSWYNALLGMAIIWFVAIFNIIGMERAKWIQNIGGFATWISIALLFIFGIVYGLKYGSANPISFEKFIPDLTNLELLPYYALVPFCFGGLELAPIMAGEIKNPKKYIPKAIFYASIAVGLIYISGTFMLLIIIPEGEIGLIEGVAQAFYAINAELNIFGLSFIGALLVTLSAFGFFGSWITGNARVPFVIGLDNYLPPAFAKVHPRYGSPVNSILMQAIVISILFLSSTAGSTIEEAFLILLDMSIVLYFIPFLYMFAAFAKHVHKDNGQKGFYEIFRKNKFTVWIVAFFGFSTTLAATVLSCMPTNKIEDKTMFVIKVVGGSIVLLAVGLSVFYRHKKGIAKG